MFLGLLFALLALGFFMLPSGAIEPGPRVDRRGTLRLLTYNVAGLPLGLSRSSPQVNSAIISPKLNPFDVVLLQEDFSFHDELVSAVTHEHRSTQPTRLIVFKDGLTRLSKRPLGEVRRVRWETCNGVSSDQADCLARKGFSFSTLLLDDQLRIHIYNLHADAGRSDGDKEARSDQMAQLAAFIREHSSGWTIIVAGDTNLSGRSIDDRAVLDRFLAETGLSDVASVLETGEARVDRVFFRSGSNVRLTPLLYEKPPEFTDREGAPLSDHLPVGVVFEWALR